MERERPSTNGRLSCAICSTREKLRSFIGECCTTSLASFPSPTYVPVTLRCWFNYRRPVPAYRTSAAARMRLKSLSKSQENATPGSDHHFRCLTCPCFLHQICILISLCWERWYRRICIGCFVCFQLLRHVDVDISFHAPGASEDPV